MFVWADAVSRLEARAPAYPAAVAGTIQSLAQTFAVLSDRSLTRASLVAASLDEDGECHASGAHGWSVSPHVRQRC